MSPKTNLTAKQHLVQILRSDHTDRRLPVLVLLNATPQSVSHVLLTGLVGSDLGRLVVFAASTSTNDWPTELRTVLIGTDELADSQGCLCCSMRSELAGSLSRLFLRLLRRQEPEVAGILIVTQSSSDSALVKTLQHAPFLGQRFRLVASLPLESA